MSLKVFFDGGLRKLFLKYGNISKIAVYQLLSPGAGLSSAANWSHRFMMVIMVKSKGRGTRRQQHRVRITIVFFEGRRIEKGFSTHNISDTGGI